MATIDQAALDKIAASFAEIQNKIKTEGITDNSGKVLLAPGAYTAPTVPTTRLPSSSSVMPSSPTPAAPVPVGNSSTPTPTSNSSYDTSTPEGIISFYKALNQPTDEQKAFYDTQSKSIKDLYSLQGQLLQAQQPTEAQNTIQTEIDKRNKALLDTTPSRIYEQTPGLKDVGITQSQLERKAIQESDPIIQSLRDLTFSGSLLERQQNQKVQQLQTQTELAQITSKCNLLCNN